MYIATLNAQTKQQNLPKFVSNKGLLLKEPNRTGVSLFQNIFSLG